MLSSEVAAIHYLPPQPPSSFPTNFPMIQTTTPSFQFSTFPTNLPNSQLFDFPSAHENFSSTSDEAEELEPHLTVVVDERKQRRMISNRESARRSRMRKQKHLHELRSQVVRFRTENFSLIEQLNHMAESHDRVVQENERMKEQISDLRQIITGLQIGSPCPALRDLEEVTFDTVHLTQRSKIF